MHTVIIEADRGTTHISRQIYGHFAEHLGRCVYEGLWVGDDPAIASTRGIRDDVVTALREIGVPVLRWPGGCFADEYHWRDGIGPRAARPRTINTHWGGVTEHHHFGTHEFFDLCDLLGAEPYICGNLGSGSAREMADWVEYITLEHGSSLADARRDNGRESPWRLPYFGLGNESWDCGGTMRPEYYADLYRHYQTYIRSFGGNRVSKIACGPNGDDYRWTDVLMREAGRWMDGLSLHHYATLGAFEPVWNAWTTPRGSAIAFGEDEWFGILRQSLRMDELVREHAAIMDRYDPERRVALIVDEWGAWYDAEPGSNPSFLYQQNTLRDALVTGITLNIFNTHADRVRMANISQLVNVVHAPILTDGPRMITTPTYHVFGMYSGHQDATLVPAHAAGDDYELDGECLPQIHVSASRDAAGSIHVTLCNLHPHREAAVRCDVHGAAIGEIEGRLLTASTMNAHNTFADPARVTPVAFAEARLARAGLDATLPPMSIVALSLRPAR